MSKDLTFTLDLEDHRPDESQPLRYPFIMENILAFLEEQKIKGTFFIVGTLAENDPELVKRIHTQGHEIAHHSYDHTTLDKQTPDEFRAHTKKAKQILEDVTGEEIIGYRAPVFSLTKETLWAVDILKELGFAYSSSVLPAANPLHGFAGAPETPFLWKNGLLEIPAPVGKIGPCTLPYLGGFYLRYLPFALVKQQISKASDNNSLWTYCHPYDFDPDEKQWRVKGASTPVSLLLWFNRKHTFRKLEKLAANYNFAPPFKEQIFEKNLPVFDPFTS
jgi:polysaccharide deacetylase family protein (PEP-CTERM system associated)